MRLKSEPKKILLITSGQPSINPRLVKEADALCAAGYDVTVLYNYWNDWATEQDIKLLATKNWKAIRVGGHPLQKKLVYFISRLIHKLSKLIIQKTGYFEYFANFAIVRGSYFLIKSAGKIKADLYIAHNLGALPASYLAAKKNAKPCGFDAEDFHRQELSDDVNSFHFKITSFLEDKYIPGLNYVIASSPLIAEQYASLYCRDVVSILNVFPKSHNISLNKNENQPLKLFWFSQTIGPKRGLEQVIDAMGISSVLSELHLLGKINPDYYNQLMLLCKTNKIDFNRIKFYSPINPDDINEFASKFDIGMAAEVDVCFNRKISLTNKLFTYLQSGLAIAASSTIAQSTFINSNTGIGRVYSNSNELAEVLNYYDANRDVLFETKKRSMQLGQNALNWEIESQKILRLVENTLAG